MVRAPNEQLSLFFILIREEGSNIKTIIELLTHFDICTDKEVNSFNVKILKNLLQILVNLRDFRINRQKEKFLDTRVLEFPGSYTLQKSKKLKFA